jgi:hypothetical protein
MFPQSHIFGKRAVALAFRTVAWLCVLPLAAQVDLGLAPMRVEFPATPGRAFSGTLTLNNAGKSRTRVRTELLDMYVDQAMTPQFVSNAPAEKDFSCRQWLSVNPMELEIDGRSQVPIRFTVRIPASANERSYHCAIGFRTMAAATEQEGMGMRMAVRVIGAIYPIVGKPEIAGAIKDLKLEAVPNSSERLQRVVVVMENSGLMLYRPTGDVDLLDADGKVVESQKMAPFPVLPKRQQRFILPLKTVLAPGRYSLRLRVDMGKEIQETSAEAEVAAEAQPPK